MTSVRPDDGPDILYEFFSPFAHVEGRYEWCRIRSPTHGVFDTFILVGAKPVVVYVNSREGAAFMSDRFPACETYRVPRPNLSIRESAAGRRVVGRLRSSKGPLRAASMTLKAPTKALPTNIPYGGTGAGIWGSPYYTCWGVDLVLKATATGRLDWTDGRTERLAGEPALVTLGSFGRISPLALKNGSSPATASNRQRRRLERLLP